MPIKAPVFRPAGAATRKQQKQAYDRHRRKAQPWRSFYDTSEWKARRRAKLSETPYCERCSRRGVTALATVANHRVPHRGDWALFIGGELESVCKHCHDSEIQREERAMGGG